MNTNVAYRFDDDAGEAATSSVFSRQMCRSLPEQYPSVGDYSISGTQVISLDEPRHRFRIQLIDASDAGFNLLSGAARSINALLSLAPGWDSYNGLPTSEGAARKAINILSGLVSEAARFPAIVPTGDGGVQLEWHNNGWDVEIEVDPQGTVSAFVDNGAFSNTWSNHQLPRDPRFIEALQSVISAE